MVGKIQGGGGEKIFFKCFAFSRKTFTFPRETLRSLAKVLRSLAKIFPFSCKTFGFSRKDICVPSQNFCVLSQNQLSSDKLFLFTLQLAVVHTAPYVHNGADHRDLF